VNSCTFAGRVGSVKELKRTQGGEAVLNFSLAVDRAPRNGEKQKPLWVEVALWGKQAEVLQPYVVTGGIIAVTGEVDLRTFEYNGENRTSLIVKFPRVKLLGGGQKQERESGAAEVGDEDIPF